MKRRLSDREVAQEMANIMVDHLETLPAEERHKKIQAGQKVMKDLKKSTSSSASEKSAKAHHLLILLASLLQPVGIVKRFKSFNVAFPD